MNSVSSSPNLVQYDKSHRNEKRNTAVLDIYADMAVLRHEKDLTALPSAGGGRRKPITTFSRKSKLNLQRQLARIRNRERPLWLTFTYTDEAWHAGEVSASRAKRDLDAMLKRLARLDENLGWVWKIEYKTRKSGRFIGEIVPHYHVLLLGSLHDLGYLRMTLRQAWNEITDPTGCSPHVARVDVQALKSWRQVVAYIAEYMSKDDEERIDETFVKIFTIVRPGRFWGVGGKLHTECIASVELTPEQVKALRRTFAGWMKSRNRKYHHRLKRMSDLKGWSVFGMGDLSCPRYGWNVGDQYQAIFRLLDFLEAF